MQSKEDPAVVASGWKTQDPLLGGAMVVAGIAMAIAGVMHPVDSSAGMVMPLWAPVHAMFFVAIFVTLIGIVRLQGLAAPHTGGLGLVAFVLFTFGLVGFAGVMLLEVSVLPVLAASDATRGLTEDTGALMAGPLGVWLLCIAVAFSIGAIVFGLMLPKVKELPRWAGPLLVTAPLFAFEPPLPQWLAKLGLVVFALGLVGLGWGVSRLPQHRSSVS